MTNEATKEPSKHRSKLFFIIVAGMLLAICAAGVTLVVAREPDAKSPHAGSKSVAIRRVLVVPVGLSPGFKKESLPATINGYIETHVYAKIPGYLKSIRVDKGSRVKKGEILAVLASPETDKNVADARANFWIQRQTDERDQKLMKAGVLSPQTADTARAMMLEAKATYHQMLAMQAYELIRAPFDGVVTARYVDPGTLIPQSTTQTSGTPIVSLATLQPVRVYTYVPQTIAPFVKDGDPAVVTVGEYPRRQFEGTITRHPDALSPDSRSMLAEVDLPNRERLLYPGMYAMVHFSVRIPDRAPTVPDDSLIFDNGNVYVPLVRGNRLHLVKVTLGYDNGLDVEVTKGVRPGDLVAVDVGQAAHDGELVQPIRSDARRRS